MDQTSSPIRILLVDDNPADVRLTHEGLRQAGVPYELEAAFDGQQALDILLQTGAPLHPRRPDLVLLDLNLPRKTGHEVLREIKSSAALRHIPVIVYSSSVAEEDVAKAYALSANSYVHKPGDVDELFRVMRSIVSYWSRTARLPSGTHHRVPTATAAP